MDITEYKRQYDLFNKETECYMELSNILATLERLNETSVYIKCKLAVSIIETELRMQKERCMALKEKLEQSQSEFMVKLKDYKTQMTSLLENYREIENILTYGVLEPSSNEDFIRDMASHVYTNNNELSFRTQFEQHKQATATGDPVGYDSTNAGLLLGEAETIPNKS